MRPLVTSLDLLVLTTRPPLLSHASLPSRLKTLKQAFLECGLDRELTSRHKVIRCSRGVGVRDERDETALW